jgi:hypothetical protein
MALQLNKTLVGKQYTLYIELLYISCMNKTDKLTGEKTETVRADIYESKEHHDAGFPPMLKRRWENVKGNETYVVPFTWSDQAGYRKCLQYIHEYIRDNIAWYAGATIIEPIDLSNDEAPKQDSPPVFNDVRDNPDNILDEELTPPPPGSAAKEEAAPATK